MKRMPSTLGFVMLCMALAGCPPNSNNVVVSNVVGLTQAVASTTIVGAGLAVGTVTQAYSWTVDPGLIISQNPVSGMSVSPGAIVSLIISKGPPPVPNVVGLTQEEASTSLIGVELATGLVTVEYSWTVSSGLVISQMPASGTSVSHGAKVALTVSTGPPPVPNLVGLSSSSAYTAITNAGFAVGKVTHQCSDDIHPGAVISQTPTASVQVAHGTTIVLAISIGGCNQSLPGTDGPVDTIVTDVSGNVYIGGGFDQVGNVTAQSIASWNGTEWLPLGAGVNGSVHALTLDGSGNLYAGGSFTTAGGVIAHCIAKWDGLVWSALGDGMDGPVLALSFDRNGDLCAGGDFTNAGGVAAGNIAKWDGNVWSPLGSGTDGPVSTTVISSDGLGNLYAGGRFASAGGLTVHDVAMWNGTAWSALSLEIGGRVEACAVDAFGNLYAGGDINYRINYGVGLVKWNGHTWSCPGSARISENERGLVYALVVDGSGNLYVGGYFTRIDMVPARSIAKWDGSKWSALGSGIDDVTREYPGLGTVNALAVDGSGNLYVSGSFTTAGGVEARNIARWNGLDWGG